MEDSFYLDPTGVYRSTALESLPWLEHGFGTRLLMEWLERRKVTTVRQVHSDIVLLAAGDSDGCVGEGDALISNQAGMLIAVKTADCLPVLIADRTRRVIAAVHAGWRGTIADICGKTIATMAMQGSEPKDLMVAIGPGIGPCCFEVGPEVGSRFREALPERDDLDQRTRIDLVVVNMRYLERVGLSIEQISAARLCTCCDGAVFESFRRDKQASGRMWSAIGIR